MGDGGDGSGDHHDGRATRCRDDDRSVDDSVGSTSSDSDQWCVGPSTVSKSHRNCHRIAAHHHKSLSRIRSFGGKFV